MLSGEFIERCEAYLASGPSNQDPGHDPEHIRRVRRNALLINDGEKMAGNDLIELCAMFHEVADHKFCNDPSMAILKLRDFLAGEGISDTDISTIVTVAENISYSRMKEGPVPIPVMAVVMDADRLDAMGAIGIARAFTYGGFRNRPLYGEYLAGTTYGHFFEKLLLLKDLMNTATAMKMAGERHRFMETFLGHFERETGVEPATLSLGS